MNSAICLCGPYRFQVRHNSFDKRGRAPLASLPWDSAHLLRSFCALFLRRVALTLFCTTVKMRRLL